MNFRSWRAALCATLVVVAASARAGNRFDDFTKKFAETPDQAKVMIASPLGGEGTEFFTSGGFQPDGTIVLVGNYLGKPSPKIGGAEAKLLGAETKARDWAPRLAMKNGKPEENKDGTPKYSPPSWSDPAAGALVLRMNGETKKVISIARFGPGTIGVTACAIGPDTSIYLAGPVGPEGEKAIDWKNSVKVASDVKAGAVARTYLMKLSPDAVKIVWATVFDGPSSSPMLGIEGGKLFLTGADARLVNFDGETHKVFKVPGGVHAKVAVNALEGWSARGGERHWPTGREPWRDPHLYIHHPDGEVKYEFYNWDGPFVGLDNLRLVSDSAIRRMTVDPDGNLVFYAWSDGGNSVMYREPFDVRSYAKGFQGLGMSAYGAGVLSCAYVIKLDPKTWKVVGGTLWLAFIAERDKPNSIWIDEMGFAPDGGLAFGGRSAYGLIQTGNSFGTPPTGNYVALLTNDYSSLRFCSALPACGKAEVGEGANFGVVSGKRKGRDVVMFVGGCVIDEDVQGKTLAPPATNPAQKSYGGGHADGYFLILDAGK